MSIQEKIERLIEERRAEAAKKDLPRKLKAIAKHLGFAVRDSVCGEIMEGGFGYFTSPAFYEVSELEAGELPTDPTIDKSYILAYHFDGVSNGVNMQVHYDESAELLKAHFEGNEIYREQFGTIECYVPSAKWETHVESLFRAAERRGKLKERQDRVDKKERGERKLTHLLEQLRKLWGV